MAAETMAPSPPRPAGAPPAFHLLAKPSGSANWITAEGVAD